jgi:hypothetical protein
MTMRKSSSGSEAAAALLAGAACAAPAPRGFGERPGDLNPPAGTVVGAAGLPGEGLLIAVDATAVVRAMFRPLEERERRGRPYG